MAVRGPPLVTGRRSWPGVPGSITMFRTPSEGPIATGVDNLRPVVRRQYNRRDDSCLTREPDPRAMATRGAYAEGCVVLTQNDRRRTSPTCWEGASVFARPAARVAASTANAGR